MEGSSTIKKLVGILEELGIRTVSAREASGSSGYPTPIKLPGGDTLWIDLPDPGLLCALDPDQVGLAVLDHLGHPTRVWGLAARIEHFQASKSCLETELAALVEGAFRGCSGALYLNGYRYFAASLPMDDSFDVAVLVTDAQEEHLSRKKASSTERSANALKIVGKALTTHQKLEPLCKAAVHAIASTTELAAVLIWTAMREENLLQLSASLGANRQGTRMLTLLNSDGGATCAAELVATTRTPYVSRSVYDNVMTSQLEAQFCYLKPGGVTVLPLMIGDRLIGVLELISKEGDAAFYESGELYATIAEHLSLALNSALLYEDVERLATTDSLTGISNHRHLQEFLHRRVAEAERSKTKLGVIMMDVDHFRQFNEEEGHEAGDEVLRLVAHTIHSALRAYDLAARYGGEEFAVVLPGSDRQETMQTAERLRSRIEKIDYRTLSGRVRQVTASLGAAFLPKTSQDPASLLRAADIALYRAKKGGRNRCVAYEGKLKEERVLPELDLDLIYCHIHPEDADASEALGKQLDAMLDTLADGLSLSRAQKHILKAMARLVPTYRRVVASQDREALARMEASHDLRPIMPSLLALAERYDGTGPRETRGPAIPLLSRVLAVVLALHEEGGAPFVEDHGRFDPEVVALAAELEQAA